MSKIFIPSDYAQSTRLRYGIDTANMTLDEMASKYRVDIFPSPKGLVSPSINYYLQNDGLRTLFLLPGIEDTVPNRMAFYKLIAMNDMFHIHQCETMDIPSECYSDMVEDYVSAFVIDSKIFIEKFHEYDGDVASLADYFVVAEDFIRPMVNHYQKTLDGYLSHMINLAESYRERKDD